jgi:uroporphyrinogen III methyltransferase/synthase
MTARNPSSKDAPGLAVLIGAGPGDPELLTLAGQRHLQRADVVIYDRLAPEKLLDFCRPEAKRIYVGKTPGQASKTQEQINDLIVSHVKQGYYVARLKGGDPFVFGRGGEEGSALARENLAFRVVPGVTAGVAALAYAGIPLTDRRCGPSAAFVTGHEDPEKEESGLDFQALAGIDTLVFYMGIGRLEALTQRLIEAGKDSRTPAALIHRGTTPGQRVVTAELGSLAEAARREQIRPPSLIVVGPVVVLREQLAWFDALPLLGRTVLVTRTRTQASQLSARLLELGAEVIEAPTIEIQPVEDFTRVDRALGELSDYDWVVLTSPNGADALCSRLAHLGLDARSLAGAKIAAVGPGTRKALAERMLSADLMPEKYVTEELARALVETDVAGKRLCLLRSDLAGAEMVDILLSAGAKVDDVAIYRTVRPAGLAPRASEALGAGEVDWVTFTSSSTAENFLALTDPQDLSGLRLASIGPITSRSLRDNGLEPAVEASTHTIDGLVEAIRLAEAGNGH